MTRFVAQCSVRRGEPDAAPVAEAVTTATIEAASTRFDIAVLRLILMIGAAAAGLSARASAGAIERETARGATFCRDPLKGTLEKSLLDISLFPDNARAPCRALLAARSLPPARL